MIGKVKRAGRYDVYQWWVRRVVARAFKERNFANLVLPNKYYKDLYFFWRRMLKSFVYIVIVVIIIIIFFFGGGGAGGGGRWEGLKPLNIFQI